MNIALLSPSKNAYSETFIQVQKRNLTGNVFYYYDGHLPCRLEGEGSIIIKNASLKRKLGLISGNTRLSSLKKSFSSNNIDVVLAQYGPTGNAVKELCNEMKLPLVVHFHGYDASVKNIILNNNNYESLFNIAKAVIAVSKDMVKDLINIGCPSSKIVYNPCAPDNKFLDVEQNITLKKQFIALGRFTDKKAPYLTILAFKKVLDKFPNYKLILGGTGSLLNACINIVKYLNIESSVEFAGVLTQDEFIHYLKDSVAFVQHSITAMNGDKEGTPVAVLEASAAGLPVVSTLHAGIKDVILHQETGLLSNESDVEQMANHMMQIIESPEKSRIMGLKGKARIKEKFSLKQHIKMLQKTLELDTYER